MNDYVFINRKNYHSINVQVICDAKLSLLNMAARRDTRFFYISKKAVLVRGAGGLTAEPKSSPR